jgi:hypothetical protein
MLALHRTGRRAVALAFYRDGRELLVEALGIEPGPELRAIDQALLTDDFAMIPVGPSACASPGGLMLPLPAQQLRPRPG